jgi:hypothetical protein
MLKLILVVLFSIKMASVASVCVNLRASAYAACQGSNAEVSASATAPSMIFYDDQGILEGGIL